MQRLRLVSPHYSAIFCSSTTIVTTSVILLLATLLLTLFNSVLVWRGGTRWHSWLRYCDTSQKVAGSIPDVVIGVFHWHYPSSCAMALGLTQPLTEMSNRNISWGKGGRCLGLTTLPPSCADCFEIWEPQPPGNLRACPGCNGIVYILLVIMLYILRWIF